MCHTYRQELEEERQRCEEAADKRVQMITSAINKSVKRKQQENEATQEATVSMRVFDAEKVCLSYYLCGRRLQLQLLMILVQVSIWVVPMGS